MPVQIKYGKIYMKDAVGNLVQIIPEAAGYSVGYQGATASAPGVSGLVPAAEIADRNKYLKGDGTWAELTLPSDYVGATSSANGVHGLVPAATIADRNKYFKGDGTWAEIADIDTSTLLLDNYQKAASVSAVSSSDSVLQAIGKLEKAIDGKQDSGSYLTASSTLDATKLSGTASINTTGNASTATKATQDGSGNVITATYATKAELPSDYIGATSSANGVHGLVPAAAIAEKDCFLCGDGTWDAISGMTNAQIDTAMANVGYIGNIDPSLLTSITNSEIDALFA